MKFFVHIDGSGKVDAMLLTRGIGSGLDEAATKALLKTWFAPATLDGKPVAAWVRAVVQFRFPIHTRQ